MPQRVHVRDTSVAAHRSADIEAGHAATVMAAAEAVFEIEACAAMPVVVASGAVLCVSPLRRHTIRPPLTRGGDEVGGGDLGGSGDAEREALCGDRADGSDALDGGGAGERETLVVATFAVAELESGTPLAAIRLGRVMALTTMVPMQRAAFFSIRTW